MLKQSVMKVVHGIRLSRWSLEIAVVLTGKIGVTKVTIG